MKLLNKKIEGGILAVGEGDENFLITLRKDVFGEDMDKYHYIDNIFYSGMYQVWARFFIPSISTLQWDIK